jgi:hypothetical protein
MTTIWMVGSGIVMLGAWAWFSCRMQDAEGMVLSLAFGFFLWFLLAWLVAGLDS